MRRIPVEPLPERSRSRIERELMAALEREPAVEAGAAEVTRAWPLRWLLGGGFALATAAAAAMLLARAGDAPSGGAEPLRVATAASATRVTVGGVALDVGPESALVATEDLVVIERGRARFAVAPRGGRAPFAVVAGEVRVEVVGTEFEVARAGERATVVVFEGTVRVVARGEAVLVGAGERWPREQAAAPEQPPAEPDGEHDTIVIDDGMSLSRPRRPAAPASPKAPPPPAADSDQLRFERAARLERGAPDEAMKLYLEVAEDGGAWAGPALYAAGRLAMARGDGGRGRELLADYLRRFPSGANAADARRLLR